MNFIAEKLKSIADAVSTIERKIGFFKFIQYSMFFCLLYTLFNFSSIVESVVKIQTQFEKREHDKKMALRDKMMLELNPLLVELRSGTGASRVLYFEYHNSIENFIGIPFKFANLVMENQSYGCPRYDVAAYRDISSGLISGIYSDLKRSDILVNKGSDMDPDFIKEYPEVHEFFCSRDKSVQHVFINLPGIDSPMGMIILEWVKDDEITDESQWEKIISKVHQDLPRINALISKYMP